jgi:hypothetical protein
MRLLPLTGYWPHSDNPVGSGLDVSLLSANPCGYFGCYETPYESPRPFDEYKFVCQTAFQQKADGIVAGQIGRLYQHFVFSNSKMAQAASLAQEEDRLCDGILYFRHFFTEVLNKDFFKTAAELYGPLADHLETLIDCVQVLFRNPSPRFQRFFHVWILGLLADLLNDFCRPLRVLPSVTKKHYKKFPGVSYWHGVLLLIVLFRFEIGFFRWADGLKSILLSSV